MLNSHRTTVKQQCLHTPAPSFAFYDAVLISEVCSEPGIGPT